MTEHAHTTAHAYLVTSWIHTNPHQSEWLSSKNPQTTNAGEGVERREPS